MSPPATRRTSARRLLRSSEAHQPSDRGCVHQCRYDASAMSNADNLPRDLLKVKVPEGVPTETGFFEISGTASSEAVNSRVYRWFLDRKENPQLAPLFCDALQHLALDKLGRDGVTKHLTLQEYECSLEVETSSRKRIDILMDDTAAQSAIIIENKLHHSLQNDLLDYWNHVLYPVDQKLGVLLTLHQTNVPDEFKSRFVNVTHLEWIEAVEAEGIPVGLPLHTYGLMTDFFNSIRNQSRDARINEQARFFFDHRSQVARVIECWKEAKAHIESELKRVAEQLQLSHEKGKGDYCYLKDHHERFDVFYTVVYENLLSSEDSTITIIIELISNAMQYVDFLDKSIDGSPASNALESNCKKHRSYVHFRAKEFPLDRHEIDSFSEILVPIIQNQFEPVMNIVRKRLDDLDDNK